MSGVKKRMMHDLNWKQLQDLAEKLHTIEDLGITGDVQIDLDGFTVHAYWGESGDFVVDVAG